jgi:glucosamine kinase
VPYYIGIDGGGTKTLCAVGDESQTLATATAGPSNVIRVGEMQARESLHQSVRQACAAAGIAPGQVKHACIGAAGAARPEIAETVRRVLAEILPAGVNVVGDMQVALEAAFNGGPGVVVIAGTGSIAYGRDAQGNTARAGGWGFAVSDEGSAHWIGRAAAALLVGEMDRTEGNLAARAALLKSPFAATLLKALSVTSLEDFARAAGVIAPHDFASLFPAVIACPDDTATQILASAGTELAHLASVVIHRLFPSATPVVAQPADSSGAFIPVAMVGGVFRHAPLVRQIFYNQVRRFDARVRVQEEIVEPVEGALRIARKSV